MKKPQRAFTLLEIMLVVSIIGVLLAAAIYKMAPTLGFAKTTRAQGDISGIRTCLIAYSGTNGFYPSTEQGLAALVNKPGSEPVPGNWHRLMESVPKDAYGSAYIYRNPSRKGGGGYDLFSAGEDRIPDTQDDEWASN
jgi:general secretion pathway protein G